MQYFLLFILSIEVFYMSYEYRNLKEDFDLVSKKLSVCTEVQRGNGKLAGVYLNGK